MLEKKIQNHPSNFVPKEPNKRRVKVNLKEIEENIKIMTVNEKGKQMCNRIKLTKPTFGVSKWLVKCITP